MITERDYQNILATAREQGHDAGFAEGREAGRAEGRSAGLVEGEVRGKLAIARKLLASGMQEAQVSEFTGLTAVVWFCGPAARAIGFRLGKFVI